MLDDPFEFLAAVQQMQSEWQEEFNEQLIRIDQLVTSSNVLEALTQGRLYSGKLQTNVLTMQQALDKVSCIKLSAFIRFTEPWKVEVLQQIVDALTRARDGFSVMVATLGGRLSDLQILLARS